MRTLRATAFSLALVAGVAFGNVSSGGQFELQRSVIASGGGQSSGGEFAVQGTTGQAEAARSLNGSTVILAPGFWGAPGTDLIFQDAFEVSL